MCSFVFPTRQTNKPEMLKVFQETIFDHKLIETWLDFYTKQLKRDLLDESRAFLNALELAEEQQRIIKSDLSLINLNACNKYSQARSPIEIKKLNSKILFESIKTLLLLVNKLSRLSKVPTSAATVATVGDKKKLDPVFTLPDQIGIKKVRLNITLSLFVDSMTAIINYLHELNYHTMRVQQEQQQFYPDMDTLSVASMPVTQGRRNFITLKQSSEIIKQFHSLSNSLMILVTSLNDL